MVDLSYSAFSIFRNLRDAARPKATTITFILVQDPVRLSSYPGVTEGLVGYLKRTGFGDFPSGPGIRTPCCHCRGHRFSSWSMLPLQGA